jgi:hypothetical protein
VAWVRIAGAVSHTLFDTAGFYDGITLLLAVSGVHSTCCPPGALLSFASVVPSMLSAYGASDVLMPRGRRERGVGAPRVNGTLTGLAGAVSHALVVTVVFDDGSALLLAASGAYSSAWLPPPNPPGLRLGGAVDAVRVRRQ